jgi:hypothetical protein
MEAVKHIPPFTEIPRDNEQIAAERGYITPKQNQINEAMAGQVVRMEADPDSVQKKLNALRKGDLDEGFMEKRRQAIEARPQLSNDIPEEPKRLSLGGKVMKFVRKYLYW